MLLLSLIQSLYLKRLYLLYYLLGFGGLEEENNNMSEKYLVNNPGMAKYLNDNYILKSKVKEKIEELNKLIIEAQKELGSASKEYTIYVYQKDILQELLEKR